MQVTYKLFSGIVFGLLGVVALAGPLSAAQQPDAADGATAESASDPKADEPSDEPGKGLGNTAKKAVDDVRDAVDKDERAQEAADNVLNPIYQMAEASGKFSAFYWLAFAVMVAGVVSYAGQLVLGKLVVLMHMHFSVMEILSDGLGLLVSLVGLVLTTQAATENSSFTESPAAVLSATILGAVIGIVFYFWGQSQEIKAARAARKKKAD